MIFFVICHCLFLSFFVLLLLLPLLCVSVSGEGCSLVLKPSRVVVGFGESVSVSCEATRPVRVLGWESSISAVHTQQDLSVQWKADSLIDWIEEPICYGVFFTAPRQCEEKLNLVLYSALALILKKRGGKKELFCFFCFFCALHFCRSCMQNTPSPQRFFCLCLCAHNGWLWTQG